MTTGRLPRSTSPYGMWTYRNEDPIGITGTLSAMAGVILAIAYWAGHMDASSGARDGMNQMPTGTMHLLLILMTTALVLGAVGIGTAMRASFLAREVNFSGYTRSKHLGYSVVNLQSTVKVYNGIKNKDLRENYARPVLDNILTIAKSGHPDSDLIAPRADAIERIAAEDVQIIKDQINLIDNYDVEKIEEFIKGKRELEGSK